MLITTVEQVKKLKHGQRVSVKFGTGKSTNDAKVSIEEGTYFVCQSIFNGVDNANNSFGYNGSCQILYGGEINTIIEELRTLDKTSLEDMEVGDILVSTSGDERKILAVSGLVFLPSRNNQFDIADEWLTFHQIKDCWKFKEAPQEETQVELTLEEIAEKLNIPVKNLRIKD